MNEGKKTMCKITAKKKNWKVEKSAGKIVKSLVVIMKFANDCKIFQTIVDGAEASTRTNESTHSDQ